MSRKGRARRIAIVGRVGRLSVRRAVVRLARSLARRGHQVRLTSKLADEAGGEGHPISELAPWCHIMVTLGGDGTVLAGARAMAGRSGTILPINFGGLGFLTAADGKDLNKAMNACLAGKWDVTARSVVRATLVRRGRTIRRGLALNDVVVKGTGGYAAVHLRLFCSGADLGHLVADGIIAATAAGSTAYSLSAGGPVLTPDVQAMIVTPVCAHSLGSRSLVLDPSSDVLVRVIGSFDRVHLSLDGQDRFDLQAKDEVRIRLQTRAVRVFVNPDQPFTQALQAKLGWQGSARRSM